MKRIVAFTLCLTCSAFGDPTGDIVSHPGQAKSFALELIGTAKADGSHSALIDRVDELWESGAVGDGFVEFGKALESTSLFEDLPNLTKVRISETICRSLLKQARSTGKVAPVDELIARLVVGIDSWYVPSWPARPRGSTTDPAINHRAAESREAEAIANVVVNMRTMLRASLDMPQVQEERVKKYVEQMGTSDQVRVVMLNDLDAPSIEWLVENLQRELKELREKSIVDGRKRP